MDGRPPPPPPPPPGMNPQPIYQVPAPAVVELDPVQEKVS